jgi:hypothetical protein
MSVMELSSLTQTVNLKYKHAQSRLPSVFTVFLVCWVLVFLFVTVVLLFRPTIVPYLVGKGRFEGEKVADETVGEKKWEIILQSIVSVGLVGGIGLLYRYWEDNKRTEQLKRESDREKMNFQVQLLREFFGSYIQLHHSYKKIRRKLKAP